MPNTIQHKRSSTPGAVPSAGTLVAGELAVNTADGIVYLKRDNGTVVASSQDEVVEFLTTANFPATGNSSLLYIATDAGRAYRWVGSQYAEVGPTAVAVMAYSSLTGVPSTFAPSSHASSHGASGSDPVTVATSQVTGLQAAIDSTSLINALIFG